MTRGNTYSVRPYLRQSTLQHCPSLPCTHSPDCRKPWEIHYDEELFGFMDLLDLLILVGWEASHKEYDAIHPHNRRGFESFACMMSSNAIS
jgi:hypothetical protein